MSLGEKSCLTISSYVQFPMLAQDTILIRMYTDSTDVAATTHTETGKPSILYVDPRKEA